MCRAEIGFDAQPLSIGSKPFAEKGQSSRKPTEDKMPEKISIAQPKNNLTAIFYAHQQ